MFYEDFNKQVTDASQGLFSRLEKNSEKHASAIQKIIENIVPQTAKNYQKLTSLSENFQKTIAENELTFQAFENKLSILSEQLKTGFSSFDEGFNKETEESQLLAQRDKTLQAVRYKYRRDIAEANNKIEKLEREKQDTIQVKQVNFDEEEKNYKQKLIEIEKKKKFEIQKIQNNTTKECGELQKALLIENNRKQIENLNRKIKAIRHANLIAEKKVMLNMIDEIEKVELAFAELKQNFKFECVSVENNFVMRIEDSKVEQLIIEQNYQAKLDEYDCQVYDKVKEMVKAHRLKRNQFQSDHYEKEINQYVEIINFKKKSQKDLYKQSLNYFDESNKFDLKHYGDTDSIESSIKNLFNQLNPAFNDYIIKLITNINLLLLNKYRQYLNKILEDEQQIITNYICLQEKEAITRDFNIREFRNKLFLLIDHYKSLFDKLFLDFKNLATEALKRLIKEIENYAETFDQINETINKSYEAYRMDLKNVINASHNTAIANLESKNNSDLNNITSEEITFNNRHHNNQLQISLENDKIENQYLEEENRINDLRKTKSEKANKQLNESKTNCENIKRQCLDNILKAKTELKEQTKLLVKEIKNKTVKDKKNTENDFQLKIELL